MGDTAHYPSITGWVEQQLNATASEVIERSVVPQQRPQRERSGSIETFGLKSTLSDISPHSISCRNGNGGQG